MNLRFGRMAEPFKNVFNEQLVKSMAGHLYQQWPQFNQQGFIKVATNDIDSLELKQRSDQIKKALTEYLPDEFSDAAKVLLASLAPTLNEDEEVKKDLGISSWGVMPLADYVGEFGLADFDLSMKLFKESTQRFTAEFGIRYFLLAEPEKTLSILEQWTEDENKHVRRLVSEGVRPRLPWAMQLPMFIKNPAPVIKLLDSLKDDKEEYVRRSVANNLNDIAKDHPELVADIAERWMEGASTQRQKLIRHACRTLIKQGHKRTLAILGYSEPDIKEVVIDLQTPEVIFGQALLFSMSLVSTSHKEQALIVDYIIHHQKANGKLAPKVFKWRTTKLAANKMLTISKKHVIKKITTRVYYSGKHTLEVIVNGVSIGETDFQLVMP